MAATIPSCHNMTMNRRHFITQSLFAALAASLPAASGRPPRILLRSSWQTINIGDIGHTPGVLRLIEEFIPGAEVRLWPGDVGNGVREMLLARFPKLTILTGGETVKKALEECDFFLHGSGPSLVAARDLEKWVSQTGKPYGVFGITLFASVCPDLVKLLLSGSTFVYFRDSVSLAFAKSAGISCPIMGFGPDGAFAVDLRHEKAALDFLKAHHLEEGKFLCCIPRYRNTPEWLIPRKNKPVNEAAAAQNEAMKEHDHRPHREAIEVVTAKTDLKILLVPEDETQVALGKEMIYDKLSPSAKAKVVWRDRFWLTDEALSTYVRSAGLFGNEMHSPIMCIGNGIPALVCRWGNQTSKGFMWEDLGMPDWLFDFDKEDSLSKLPAAVLELAQNPARAKAKAMAACHRARTLHQKGMATLKGFLPPA